MKHNLTPKLIGGGTNTLNEDAAGAGTGADGETEPAEETSDQLDNADGTLAEDAGDFGVELMSIGDGATHGSASPTTMKEYLLAHTGTYVTEKNYVNGDNTYEGNLWTIEITEDSSNTDYGVNIKLLYDGVDTGAVVTNFGNANATTGAPVSFTFELNNEDGTSKWTTGKDNTAKATLVFGWNAAGWISFPNNGLSFWWDRDSDGAKEQYKFSSQVRMYNQTKTREFFKGLADTYTINDNSGWKITVDENGDLKMTDGDEIDDIFVDYVNFGNAVNTYENVTSIVFSSANWYNANGGTNNYNGLTVTWGAKFGVNANGTTDTGSRADGFVRNAFMPNGTMYNTDKTILKYFRNTYTLFTPDKGDYSTEYFKGIADEYSGKYIISDDYGKNYAADLAGWSVEVREDGGVYVTYGGQGPYKASFVSARNEKHLLTTESEEWRDSVATMYVYLPGYYTDEACTIPAYLTLTWNILNGDKWLDEGEPAGYFTFANATLYKNVNGEAELLRTPTIYADHETQYVAKAKNFLANYAGTYYYNYAGDTGEIIEISAQGDVTWDYYDGEKIVERTPTHYNFANANNTNYSYLQSDEPTLENQWTVGSMYFTDGNWYDSNQKTTANDRVTLTMNFDVTHERFRPNLNNYTVYGAKVGDEAGPALRTYNAYDSANGGANRESYIRFNKASEFLKSMNMPAEYTLDDQSGWKLSIADDGRPTLTNGDEATAGNIKVVDVTYTTDASAGYPAVKTGLSSFTFTSSDWRTAAGMGYQTIILSPSQYVNPNIATDKPEGFLRDVFYASNSTFYNADGTLLKGFNGNSMFTPVDVETFDQEYFKNYSGTYEISADYGTYYDPEFKDWKLEIDENGNVTMQYAADGPKYKATLTTVANRALVTADGGDPVDFQYPSAMYVYVPGYYSDAAMTKPAYLALNWYINDTAQNASVGQGRWRFEIPAANLYRAGADGTAETLRTPLIYADHTERYIGMAKSFLKNYAGTYYYNYADAVGEYMGITGDGSVNWYWSDGTTLHKRTPVHYNIVNFNISGSNNSVYNYINGEATYTNPWQVSGVIFADGDWYANDNSTTADARTTVTMGFNFEYENFTAPGNYQIYSAKNGDAPGKLIRTFNASGVGNGGTDRERYIRFDKVNEFLNGMPKEYALNDNSGWKISIDANGQPALTDGDIMTAGNIKIKYVSYVEDRTVFPYVKTAFSGFIFTSSDWYNQAGTQNYQTLSPTWSRYVSPSATSPESPEGFERYVFNTNATLWKGSPEVDEDGSPKIHDQRLKVFTNNLSMFTADGGYTNEYFKGYQGTYELAPGFGANYNSMYRNWKIEVDEYGSVTVDEGTNGVYKAVIANANRVQFQDAEGNVVADTYVPSVSQMYVYLPGYYSDVNCTSPAYLTLTWNINNNAAAQDHRGDAYKYFTAGGGYFYQPDADGDGQAEKFKAPTLYFMHTDYMNWYKNYYKQYAGVYPINSPGSEEYIEIRDDGTPVYHAFDGEDHELIFVNMSDVNKYVMGDETVYPSSVVFTDYDWYNRADNESTANIYPATYAFTWANDQTANFTNARRFTAPNAAVYAQQQKGDDGSWLPMEQTELLHYFSGSMTYTYPGDGAPADSDAYKASLAEMKEYLKTFAYIPDDEDGSNEYTEYSFNDNTIDWGLRITRDGDVEVDFDDESNNFVPVSPRPVFGYNATHPEYGLNGRYLSTLLIEVPKHYNDAAATQPAFITLTWANGNSAAITTHYFTAGGTLYHKPGEETAHDKVVLSGTARFVADGESDEESSYMSMYAGEYYANDGSNWKMKVTKDGKVLVKFNDDEDKEENYTEVSVAPTFTENATYGRYVSSITINLPGWYSNTECTQNAMLTLSAFLTQTGANQDYINNYFTMNAAVVYRPGADGQTGDQAEHMTISTIDLASEHDYENAKQWLSQNKYKGVYRPRMTDKWYAEVEDDGSVYFYVDNGNDEAGNIQYKKIRPHITLRAELNDTTHVAGGVSGFSVMFPNARATRTIALCRPLSSFRRSPSAPVL